MGDDLENLLRLDSVIERQVEVVRHFDCLTSGDQGCDRNHTAVMCDSPGRFHRSERGPLAYFSRAGIIVLLSFRVCMGFDRLLSVIPGLM
jgi:hypothetical protein